MLIFALSPKKCYKCVNLSPKKCQYLILPKISHWKYCD